MPIWARLVTTAAAGWVAVGLALYLSATRYPKGERLPVFTAGAG